MGVYYYGNYTKNISCHICCQRQNQKHNSGKIAAENLGYQMNKICGLCVSENIAVIYNCVAAQKAANHTHGIVQQHLSLAFYTHKILYFFPNPFIPNKSITYCYSFGQAECTFCLLKYSYMQDG